MTAVEGMAKVQVNAVCSIARSLEVLGERWTFLILREAFSGVTRFADFPVGPTIVRRSRRTGRPLRVDFVDDISKPRALGGRRGPVRLRADPVPALERRAERERAAVADLTRDAAHRDARI
jgi:hypothetical protein